MLGCGITTGYGAATITANVQEGDNVAVFGGGCVGLSVIQGCKERKANKIILVDINDKKEEWGKQFGATDFVNSAKLPEGTTIVDKLIEMTDGGCDFTFDCTGNVNVMRNALKLVIKVGVLLLSLVLLPLVKKFPPDHSNWLPVECGKVLPSVVLKVEPNCQV